MQERLSVSLKLERFNMDLSPSEIIEDMTQDVFGQILCGCLKAGAQRDAAWTVQGALVGRLDLELLDSPLASRRRVVLEIATQRQTSLADLGKRHLALPEFGTQRVVHWTQKDIVGVVHRGVKRL